MEKTWSTFTLNSEDQRTLNDLFNEYSKDTKMKFYEFFLFCLNKKLVDNQANFETYLEAFQKEAKGDSQLDIKQFPHLLTVVAKVLRPAEKKPILSLLNDYLGNKTKAHSDKILKPRTIHPDDINKRLLHTKIIEVYIKHQEFLRNAFTLYYQTNYRGRIFFKWRQLSLQNAKLSLHQFVQMLKDVHMIPAKISIDTVTDLASKIAVPCFPEEQEFYQERKLNLEFHLDPDPNGRIIMGGDPGLHYHEFVLLLSRIAFEIYREDEVKDLGGISEVMEDFLLYHMKFGTVMKLIGGTKIDEKLFDNKFVLKMKTFQVSKEEGTIDDQVRPPSPDPTSENIKKLDQETRDILNSKPEYIIVEDIISNLDSELPSFPSSPEVAKEPKKKRLKKPLVIGEQVPVEKNANRAQKNQKPVRRRKKKEPKPEPVMLAKKMTEYKKQLEAEKKLFKLNAGTLSDIEIDPIILKEVIYPQEIPDDRPGDRVSQKEIIMHIEAGIQAQFEGRFVFSIRNFKLAEELWSEKDRVGPSDELFFKFMIASVYESACRDDLAMISYRECLDIKDVNSIDRALPYMGLGSVLFHSNEYKIAGRCFNKAIEARESFVGGNEPDTASSYNNYGCCLYKLDRIQEAFNYFKLSELIFAAKLGPFHERTLVAKRNKAKCMKKDFKLDIPWKRDWTVYHHDKTSHVGIGGKRKKGKKRKKR